MYVQIGATPENDFHNPLGLLSDCHRRIERFLEALLRVSEDTKQSCLNPAQRHALQAGLTYFREAAPLHTRDEEESLFPRLRQSPTGQRAMEWMESLHEEHEQADAWHAEVETLGQKWLSYDSLSQQERRRLQRLLKNLHDLYVVHINLEDQRVFPLAAKALSVEEIQAIGQEMAERRGVPFSFS